jgi:hypothetical protein
MVDGLADACLDFMRDGCMSYVSLPFHSHSVHASLMMIMRMLIVNSENACELFANAPHDERKFALTYIEVPLHCYLCINIISLCYRPFTYSYSIRWRLLCEGR